MRFVADESCDFSVVRELRSAGHDVLAIAEIAPRADDPEVIDRAFREDRILLTEDKDFGRLVYVSKSPNAGVVLIRFPSQHRRDLPRTVLGLVQHLGSRLTGQFAVLQPGRVRFDPKPTAG